MLRDDTRFDDSCRGPNAAEPPEVICPICTKESDCFYLDKYNREIAGCDECLMPMDREEYEEYANSH